MRGELAEACGVDGGESATIVRRQCRDLAGRLPVQCRKPNLAGDGVTSSDMP